MAEVAGGVSRPATGIGGIFLVLFIDLVGFSIVFPLFAHLLDHYSAQGSGLLAAAMAAAERLVPVSGHWQRAALFGGMLGAAYSLLQFIAAPWWGRLSDRIGRRPVLLASIAGNTLAYLLWIFAADFTLLLASRLIAGLMTGNTAAATAAVADISTPQTRSRGMGMVGMAFGLGFLLGPAIGGMSYELLPRIDQIEVLAAMGANPFSTPALIAFLLSLTNLVWVFLRFRETLPPERRHAGGDGRSASPLTIFSPALGRPAMTVNLAFAGHIVLFSGMEATLVFIAAQRCAFSVLDTTWLFIAMGITTAAVQGGVFRRLPPGTDQRSVALVGLAILAPGYLGIAAVDWFPAPVLLYAGVMVLAVGTGLVFPALSTLASLAVDASNQGRAMGSLRSAGALGRALGPLLAAVVYFTWRPAAPYVLAAVGVAVPFLLVLRFAPLLKRVDGRPSAPASN